jgi:hypothetical protein
MPVGVGVAPRLEAALVSQVRFQALKEPGLLGTSAHAFLVPQEPLRTQVGLTLRSRDPPIGPLHRPSHQFGYLYIVLPLDPRRGRAHDAGAGKS